MQNAKNAYLNIFNKIVLKEEKYIKKNNILQMSQYQKYKTATFVCLSLTIIFFCLIFLIPLVVEREALSAIVSQNTLRRLFHIKKTNKFLFFDDKVIIIWIGGSFQEIIILISIKHSSFLIC